MPDVPQKKPITGDNLILKMRGIVSEADRLKKTTSEIDRITMDIAKTYGDMARQQSIVGLLFDGRLRGEDAHVKRLSESYEKLEKNLTASVARQQNLLRNIPRMESRATMQETAIAALRQRPRTRARDRELAVDEGNLARYNKRIQELRDELQQVNTQVYWLQHGISAAVLRLGAFNSSWAQLRQSADLAGVAQTLSFSGEFNRDLVAANSSLIERTDLLRQSFKVQYETGALSKTMLDVQKEMVAVGDDLQGSYGKTLKTAVQLVEGLGMSAREAVQLQLTAKASDVEYRRLADTIATIVDTTSLAADEAARYARELTVAGRVALGAAGHVDPAAYQRNLIALSGIEGAMKDSIGSQGDITALITKFASYQKLGGLGQAFGTGGIDFIGKGGDGISTVLENIARTVGDASGPILEAYAAMLEVRPETLTELVRQYRAASAEGRRLGQLSKEDQVKYRDTADVQQRYNRQLAFQGEVYGRLGQQLVLLAGVALTPLTRVVMAASSALTRLIGIMSVGGPLGVVIKGVGLVFQTLVGGLMISRLIQVTSAIIGLSASLVGLRSSATVAALENEGGGVVSKVFKGAFGLLSLKGIGSMFSRTFSSIFGRAVAAETAEAGASVVGKSILRTVLGSVAGFFTGGMLRGILGKATSLIFGIGTGGWGFLASLMLTLVAQFWPQISAKFSGEDKAKDAGVELGLKPDRFGDAAINRLVTDVIRRDGGRMGLDVNAYRRSAFKANNLDYIDNLNKTILGTAKSYVDASAGAVNRTEGLTPQQNSDLMTAVHEQTDALGTLGAQLSDLRKDYIKLESQRRAREEIERRRQEGQDLSAAQHLATLRPS